MSFYQPQHMQQPMRRSYEPPSQAQAQGCLPTSPRPRRTSCSLAAPALTGWAGSARRRRAALHDHAGPTPAGACPSVSRGAPSHALRACACGSAKPRAPRWEWLTCTTLEPGRSLSRRSSRADLHGAAAWWGPVASLVISLPSCRLLLTGALRRDWGKYLPLLCKSQRDPAQASDVSSPYAGQSRRRDCQGGPGEHPEPAAVKSPRSYPRGARDVCCARLPAWLAGAS
jgi:hypothetical protein